MAKQSVDDLESKAARFWPSVLTKREQKASIVPRLLETQEKFIGVLYVADASPTAWMDALRLSREMAGNLFLKHLMVLTNIGGESLQRFRTNLRSFFPHGQMTYRWKGSLHSHAFASIDSREQWSNTRLGVDGPGMARPMDLSPAMVDVATMLLHGGASTDPGLPDALIDGCVVGSLIGRKVELDRFVRQRYIQVSRITGGATANQMGQLCQAHVKERLKQRLPKWDFSRHTIPGISQTAGRTDMSFDLVARSPTGKYCAIEVTFQVTTNSTIERKAGQAAARRAQLRKRGHRIAYVIDGAGNF